MSDLWYPFAPSGQRVRAGSDLRPPRGPHPVLPDLQRVEAVAQRTLRRHLPAKPRHQRPGRPLPDGGASHDPHTLLYRDTRVRLRRQMNPLSTAHSTTNRQRAFHSPNTTLSTHSHTNTGTDIVRCVNITEEEQSESCVDELLIIMRTLPHTGCLLHA